MDPITDAATPTEHDLVYPPIGWEPTPAQLPLWLDCQRRVPNIMAIAHRQNGKDEIGLKDCGDNAVEVPGNYVYCLPKTESVRTNIWNSINPDTGVSRIDEAFPPEFRIKKLDNEMIIELPTESGQLSRIKFMGSDNHTALRGASARGYYFSEWAFCDPDALGVVRPIVERNGGFMRFFTTAYGENHAFKMLVNNRNRPDWACHLITNNKIHKLVHDPLGVGIKHMQSHQIPPHRMAAILEENIDLYGPEIGQAITEREYECAFEQIVAGSFYLDLILKAEREGRIMNLAPRPELPVSAFFDIGFTDPTAIWYVQVKEDGWIDILDYEEFTITSAPELVPELKKKPWYYGGLYLPHDGAHHEFTSGTTTEKILVTAGFRVEVMPRTDDAAQIPSVRTLLPRCRFANTPAVKRGLECLRHFHNKAKTEGGRTSWSPKPVHDWCLAPETEILTTEGWKRVALLHVGDSVVTPGGTQCIQRVGIVRWTDHWVMIAGVRTTPEHLWFTKRGLLNAEDVLSQDECWTSATWGLNILAFCAKIFRFGFKDAIIWATQGKDATQRGRSSCIGWSMRLCMALFKKVMKSITATVTATTRAPQTLKLCLSSNIEVSTSQKSDLRSSVPYAVRHLEGTHQNGGGAQKNATGSPTPQKNALAEPAFDITVEQDHCYFVKGNDERAYLVSNSSHGAKAFATLGFYAPDLRGGVQPPKRIVKDFYSPSATVNGWMK